MQAARQEAALGAEKAASMQKQLSDMEQKLAGASQTETAAKLEITKVCPCSPTDTFLATCTRVCRQPPTLQGTCIA